MEILLVANPENRRVAMFVEAAERRDCRCRIVSWLDVLAGVAVDAECIRLESPGENWAVENALLGSDEREDRGRIRGLDRAYTRLCGVLESLPEAEYFTPPSAVAAMFDKQESKRRMQGVGIDAPTTFGIIRSFEALRATVAESGRQRFFVKPRHGSSASGVIALSMRADRVLAVTSAERDGERLYNSLKIRRYTTFDEVERVVDLLGVEDELLVEEWVPKASTQGSTFDLRVVAIGDEARHVVVRLSKHPMTNLHLGNSRGDLALLRAELGSRYEEICSIASLALGAFDGALYAGVDIALTPDHRRVTTFEANAFGDLLPGVVDHEGRTTYEAELDAFIRRRS